MKTNFSKLYKISFCVFSFFLTFYHNNPLLAQINASKGVPSYTNYIIGDDRPAGQQVWSLEQDKWGYLYTGTSTGLLKFDGVNWELLASPIQDYNTNIRATHLSKSGDLYYGSISDFGYVTTDSLGNPILKSIIKLIPEEILFNDIWSIHEVGGQIYFQSREAIFIYSPENQSIQIWKPDTSFMYSFSLNGRYYSHQMNLGLFVEKNGSLELISGSEFLGKDRVQVLLPFKNDGEFLVGAFAGGLYRYDGTNFNPFVTKIDSLLQTRSLYKALALPDNTYALSVLGHGFFVIDQDGKNLAHFNTKNSIPDQSVYSFHLDNTQNLWVGTNNGLSKIELFSPVTRFNSDQFEVGNILSLNSYNDNLYIGGSTQVLFIDKADGNIKRVKNMPNSQIFTIAEDGNQILTTGVGVYEIKGDQAKIIKGSEAFQTISLLISKKHPGYIFISGTFGIHVLKRKLTASNDYEYEFISSIEQVNRSVYSLVEDKSGEIWAGTQAGILFRIQLPKTASGNLDIPNAKITEYNEENGIKGISGRTVDVNGKIYTSGIEGFYFFDKKAEKFIKDSVFSFLDEIADINLDTYGLGTNPYGDVILDFKGEKRVAKIQPDSSYILYEYPFNLITSRFTNAGYTEPNGVYWFGTDEGLIRIDPKKNYKTEHTIPLYFKSVISGSSKLMLPEFLNGENPELQFKGNKISFNYISPFFIKENQIQYQTFLDGFEDEWSDWDGKTSKEFSNLPFGTYTFRVKAKNTFNTISDEITYTFVILPPWYATWWAYLSYLIAFIFLVYSIVKLQTNRILAREKEKNREKELANAKEIEKAYKDLKAAQAQLIQSEKMASLGELTAGIAHEIQNPLNFVNNFSEVSAELLDELNEEIEQGNMVEVKAIAEDLKDNLVKISHHGKRADSIVKGMLAHSRGNSSQKSPTDLNALLDECLRLSFHGSKAKDKGLKSDFKLDLDPELPKIEAVQQDLGRVFLNLINNAFYAVNDRSKTAGSEFTGIVTVSSKYNPPKDHKEGEIIVSIADNGSGIPDSIKDKIFQPFFTTKPTGLGTGLGLSLSYDIIKSHGGELKVESREGKGTEFTIRFTTKID